MTSRSRLPRKLKKLRRDPVRFFDDAKVPWVRTGGLWAVAIVICVADLVACLSTPIRYLFRAPSAGRVQLTPAKQLARQPHHWISTGEDPQFSVVPKPRTRIGGWALVTFDATSFDSRLEPILYFNDGGGFRGTAAIRLPRPDTGLVRHIVKLPYRVKALRLDPLAEPGLSHRLRPEPCK